MTTAKDYITDYIDNLIIREYAEKSLRRGYSLWINDVPEREQESLLSMLFAKDDHVRDMLLDYAQELINSRIRDVEQEDGELDGYHLEQDSGNGEYNWVRN